MSLDRSRLLTPRKTPSPKLPIRDVSRQLKNLGRLVARWNRNIKLPGARRGRLKIEQANHRADFAPHKLSREGRAILLAKRPTPGDAFARELWLCSDSATRCWSAYRFVISTSKSFSNPFYLRFIRYYFVLLTSAEQRDRTWASKRRLIPGEQGRWSLNGSIFTLRNEQFFVVRLRGRLRAVFHCYEKREKLLLLPSDGVRRCLNCVSSKSGRIIMFLSGDSMNWGRRGERK